MDIAVSNIVKTFGEVVALDGISLTIPEGSFTCFLGPSGCGKTTLLRVIAGLEKADKGEIYLGDDDLSETPPSDRNFGVVFQSYSLFPNLTAIKNVSYGLECQGWKKSKIRDRALEMLDLVQLADQANKLPSQMSGGQQQRVAIARALAPQPSLLLLDEPLSALDAKVRGQLRHEIREIQKRIGITTIMVTHDQDEALEMADQIVVLRDGKIEQHGDARELYRQPKTSFVAGFIGNINILKATADGTGKASIGSESFDISSTTEGSISLGLRPESISLTDSKQSEGVSLAGVVSKVTFLGSLHVISVSPNFAPEKLITVEIHGAVDSFQINDEVFMNFRSEALQVLL